MGTVLPFTKVDHKRRIRLQPFSDENFVLEGRLIRDQENFWEVEVAPFTTLYPQKREWQELEPPYELPTRIGAVVKSASGGIYVLTPGGWSHHGLNTLNEKSLLGLGPLTTLAEGVEL